MLTLVDITVAVFLGVIGAEVWIGKKERKQLSERLDAMAKTQAELATEMKAVVTQLGKSNDEIVGVQKSVDDLKAKVAELQAIIDGDTAGDLSQEVQDAWDAVKAGVQKVDDDVPDAIPVPPPPTNL